MESKARYYPYPWYDRLVSLATKILWVGICIAFLVVGYGLLPAGADHPLPNGFAVALQTIYHDLYALNTILPVDTAIKMFFTILFIEIWIDIKIPFITFLIKWVGRIA